MRKITWEILTWITVLIQIHVYKASDLQHELKLKEREKIKKENIKDFIPRIIG